MYPADGSFRVFKVEWSTLTELLIAASKCEIYIHSYFFKKYCLQIHWKWTPKLHLPNDRAANRALFTSALINETENANIAVPTTVCFAMKYVEFTPKKSTLSFTISLSLGNVWSATKDHIILRCELSKPPRQTWKHDSDAKDSYAILGTAFGHKRQWA